MKIIEKLSDRINEEISDAFATTSLEISANFDCSSSSAIDSFEGFKFSISAMRLRKKSISSGDNFFEFFKKCFAVCLPSIRHTK